jgi:hypothetical protein
MPAPNLSIHLITGLAAGVVSAGVIRLLAYFGGSSPGYEEANETDRPLLPDAAALYAKAWQDRKTRFFVFKAVQFSLFGLVLILLVASRKYHYMSYRMVFSIFAAWFVSYMAAGVWLNRFRCPRCRKLYYWRWDLKGATERQKRWRDCHYCGLHQDQIPQQANRALAG